MVLLMADHMRLKLYKYVGVKPGWTHEKIGYLLSRAMEEYAELVTALIIHESVEKVWSEAADVCNFLSMVAQVYE